MYMTDMRIPLSQDSRLNLNGNDYIVKSIIGYGGSCLAYSAEREPSEYERGIGMPPTPAVIKEFYPLELAENITRDGDLLCTSKSASGEFGFLKARFERADENCDRKRHGLRRC
ncbi:hypothetical protein FACS1894202_07170 [Clostridia bacterium]|nr:hypothetical protein FACS1894202_07170 [Clostridia bacterium]